MTMPPEAPNNIEQRLERYAKERREQAGDLALHPATRQLLQGEVQRQFHPAPPSTARRSWFAIWATPAFACALLLLMAGGGWYVWQTSNRPESLAKADTSARTTETTPPAPTVPAAPAVSAEKDLVVREEKMAELGTVRRRLEPTAGVSGGSAGAAVPAPVTPAVPAPTRPIASRAASPLSESERRAPNMPADGFQRERLVQLRDNEPSNRRMAAPKSGIVSSGTLPAPSPAQNEQRDAFAPQDRAMVAAKNDAINRQTQVPIAQNAPAEPATSTQFYSLSQSSLPARTDKAQLADARLSATSDRLRAGRFVADADAASASQDEGAAGQMLAPQTSAGVANRYFTRRQSRGGQGVIVTAAPPVTLAFRQQQTPGPLVAGAAPAARPANTTSPAALGRSSGGAELPILTRFTVEQNGAAIRLVDADGSVYDGRSLEIDSNSALADAKKAKAETRFAGGAAAGPYMLVRVAGTNRTLRQPVVVNARIPRLTAGKSTFVLEETISASPAKPKEVAAQIVPGAPTVPSTVPFGSARGLDAAAHSRSTNGVAMEGSLRVGQSPERSFRAKRVGP